MLEWAMEHPGKTTAIIIVIAICVYASIAAIAEAIGNRK